jgi:hypothetical protein
MTKTLIPYLAAVAIAVAGFFAGTIADVNTALGVALNKEAAKAECAELLEGGK